MVSACIVSELKLLDEADCFFLDENEAGQDEVVLWTCKGTDDRDPPKRGYYLQYTNPVSVNTSSTDLRQTLSQNPLFEEARLNQLRTEDILELLAPILEQN